MTTEISPAMPALSRYSRVSFEIPASVLTSNGSTTCRRRRQPVDAILSPRPHPVAAGRLGRPSSTTGADARAMHRFENKPTEVILTILHVRRMCRGAHGV